ncbi:MAG: pyridoxal phosphate-dependent aminotransferase, partial [Bacteroidetes bacterium]|nr:pyridoxal phosphate-dependent aminotransferase [Bacteroidota bacterium]
ISNKFKRDNNLDYKADQIVVSTGAKQSLANVVLSLINPGDEVILPVPYWVSYAAMVELALGYYVPIETTVETDFKITPEQLDNSITPKSKLFIFSSPCNPSGSVYTRSELEELAKVIAKYENLYVISDEIYEYINFSGSHESIAQFDIIKEKVVTVNGVSKGFAMTGWRIGYMGAPKWLAQACEKMQGQVTSGASGISQQAAFAALTNDLDPTIAMTKAFKVRRDLIVDLLNDIPNIRSNVPEGAFYVFPDFSHYIGKSDGQTTIEDMNDLCIYLLFNANVTVVTGKAFGDNNCIRISYSNSEENIIEAIGRIKRALEKLS